LLIHSYQEEKSMSERIVILGGGAVGTAIAQQLAAQGRCCIIAQRRDPGKLPAGSSFEACEAMDRTSLLNATRDASTVICTIGLAYDSAIWERDWPRLMTNMIAACSASGARLIFIDNLYMYGPQAEPLRENMPMAAKGRKGRVRAAITRQWQASKVEVAALRAPDFYGPGVGNSLFGDAAIGALAKGRRAMLVVKPDEPHALAYVPDVAHATVLLLDAPADAYGQVWHVPSAPARTPRDLLGIAAAELGVKPRLLEMPSWVMRLVGAFVPFIREWHETSFQHDRPFFVDSRKFEKRFSFKATSLEDGIALTARSFR
jgi:nucleoside-diphosphate-sugar epimerase